MPEWLLLLLGVVLTAGTGVFVSAEFSLVALDRRELERRRDEQGERGLDRLIRGLTRTATHLSSAQLGITLTTLLAGYTLEPAISGFLYGPLAAVGVAEGIVRPLGAVIALVLATFFSMLFGELVPKNFAIARPLAAGKLVMPLQASFTAAFKPAVTVLNGSANAILRGMGVNPQEELSGARSAEELSSLVRHSASAGKLEEDTATLLDRTLRFGTLSADDVMTPRLRIESVYAHETASAITELSGRTGLSRFPVIGEDRDDVVGVVHVKQAVAVPRAKRDEVPAGALCEEVLRVPETMHLDQLLEQLRENGYQFAIVVDEYGGTAGVVTLEDLIEELVGEVADEHDRHSADIARTAQGLLFPADLRPDELLARTGIAVPEDEDYETVAGFVLRELGRLPGLQDSVALPAGGQLRVERLDGMRIARLRYVPQGNPGSVEERADETGPAQ